MTGNDRADWCAPTSPSHSHKQQRISIVSYVQDVKVLSTTQSIFKWTFAVPYSTSGPAKIELPQFKDDWTRSKSTICYRHHFPRKPRQAPAISGVLQLGYGVVSWIPAQTIDGRKAFGKYFRWNYMTVITMNHTSDWYERIPSIYAKTA